MELEIEKILLNILHLSSNIQECLPQNNYKQLWDELRNLRNLCAQSPNYQAIIMENEQLRNFLIKLLFSLNQKCDNNRYISLKLMAWQLLANSIVGNIYTQQLLWTYFKSDIFNIIKNIEEPLNSSIDIVLMIMFNTLQEESVKESYLTSYEVLQATMYVWKAILQQQCSIQFDFLHIILEKYMVKGDYDIISCYAKFDTDSRLVFLDYMHHYLSQDNPNGLIHATLLQYISKEFKLKSDYILRISSLKEIERSKPQEAYNLLKCVATASGCELYSNIYDKDHSLFLNISSLLRCLVTISKDSNNDLFKPLNKLEEVAPSSDISRIYQQEITYELKTLLVRCIANLLYKNTKNKEYCLDTQLIPALLECTNMDARNPLMKEWSILAIRNACDDCPQIQEVIANITQRGEADNDVLKELNLQMGSLRIAPSRK